MLNAALQREGFEAFYGEDGLCYLRHVKTQTVASATMKAHRPLTRAETEKRGRLASSLDTASQDDLIAPVLPPLFRHLGFRRITAAAHKYQALEYGQDVRKDRKNGGEGK